MAENSAIPFGSREVLATIVGGGLAYLLTTHMPYAGSVVACAAIVVLLGGASRRSVHPALWWGGIGAVAGSIIGTGTTLDTLVVTAGREGLAAVRHLVVVTLAVAGFLAGIFAGKNVDHPDVPRPVEFLKRASAATVVLYALVVTASYPAHGLDAVRALSSRLSTLTTVVVTTLAVPGWIGFRIRAHWEASARARREPRGP